MHGNQQNHISPFLLLTKILQILITKRFKNYFFYQRFGIKTKENVLGFIPGRSDEIIVLSHIMIILADNGKICNGADDDGSGTSALLEIAKVFQKQMTMV